MAKKFPRNIEKAAAKVDEYARGMVTGGTLFEELGFYYVGPVDGHNLDHLLPVLKNLRDAKEAGPVLLHCVTKKGQGYKPAEESADKYHGVSKFNVVTGKQEKSKSNARSFTSVFAKGLIAEAEVDDKIVAITAAAGRHRGRQASQSASRNAALTSASPNSMGGPSPLGWRARGTSRSR